MFLKSSATVFTSALRLSLSTTVKQSSRIIGIFAPLAADTAKQVQTNSNCPSPPDAVPVSSPESMYRKRLSEILSNAICGFGSELR